MPNPAGAFGLRPNDRGPGGGPTQCKAYTKASAQASIYCGDVVLRRADTNIEVAAATGNFLGIAAHGSRTGRTERVLIYDNPGLRMIGQMDNVGGGFALADAGLNALLLYGTPAVTNFDAANFVDKSAQSISGASKAVTNTHDVKLEELFDDGVNLPGDYAIVVLTWNKHFRALQGAGI